MNTRKSPIREKRPRRILRFSADNWLNSHSNSRRTSRRDSLISSFQELTSRVAMRGLRNADIGRDTQRLSQERIKMAKKTTRTERREWTKEDVRELKEHSRAKTPVVKISKLTKRTVIGSLLLEMIGVAMVAQRPLTPPERLTPRLPTPCPRVPWGACRSPGRPNRNPLPSQQ